MPTPEELEIQRGLLEMMKDEGIPLTRENYLELIYGDNLPEELSPEQEAELPEMFQREHLDRLDARRERKID